MRQYRVVTRSGKFFAQTRPYGWWFWSDIPKWSDVFCESCYCDTQSEAEGLIERDKTSRLPQRVVKTE